MTIAVDEAPAQPAMRIALFTDTYPPQLNGVSRTLQRTARAMRYRGHDVRVFTTSDPRATDDTLVHRFAGRPFWAYPELRMAFPTARLVDAARGDWRPDLVHVATPFGIGLAGRALARRLGIPLVSSYHTSLAAYAKFYGLSAATPAVWRVLRWFHNSGAITLCPTQAISDELAARGFRNLSLWPRGIDTVAFNPAWRSDAVRASWGASPSTTVIAYVGRLAHEKGLDDALAAMCTVAETKRDIQCVIAGDGPYETECRRRAAPGTIFTGRIEGLALSETFASADVFVFPSVTDTFGNVVQEALASGLAVVAADVPQTREVIPEALRMLYQAGDSNALARAICTLVDAPHALARLRGLAADAMGDRTWDAVFDRLEVDYRSVLSARASALARA